MPMALPASATARRETVTVAGQTPFRLSSALVEESLGAFAMLRRVIGAKQHFLNPRWEGSWSNPTC